MKTERFAGHHEARQALALSVAGGDGDHAGRDFDFADLALSAAHFKLPNPWSLCCIFDTHE